MAKSLTDEQIQRIIDTLNSTAVPGDLVWERYDPEQFELDRPFIVLEIYQGFELNWKHKYHIGYLRGKDKATGTVIVGSNFGFDLDIVAFAYVNLPDIDIGSHLM